MIKPALKALWTRWKAIAHVIGDFQARLLLTLFYFLVLGPFAIGMQIVSRSRRREALQGWADRPAGDADALAWSRRQF